MPFVSKLWFQLRVRPRLMTAFAIGVAADLLAPRELPLSTRLLIAWDVGVTLYVALAWSMMWRANIDRMRKSAREQDDGAPVMLVLTVVAGLTSLAAIVIELAGIKSSSHAWQGLHLLLAGTTIVCSWTFVHTAFALHYAHEFYLFKEDTGRQPLSFPDAEQPGYWDFLYFSFVIGTTCQTADVSITSPEMRKLALLHGIVAFFFNTTLLALGINIAAGLI